MPSLTEQLRAFAAERDWEQFHSPKNLTMALSVEVAELMEHFQWLTEAESRDLDAKTKAAVSEEIADVLLYLTRLSDKLDIDMEKVALDKLKQNAIKYPVEKSRGRAAKYTEL